MELKERILHIKDKWFLTDTAYFLLLHTHTLVTAKNMQVPVLINNGSLVFSEEYFIDKSDSYLEEVIRIECMRIAMKHPYQRLLPDKNTMYLASNMIIGANGTFFLVNMPSKKELSCVMSNKSLSINMPAMEDVYNALREFIDKNKSLQSGEGQAVMSDTLDSPDGQTGGASSDSNEKTESDSNDTQTSQNSTSVPSVCSSDLCSTMEDASEITRYWDEDSYIVTLINDTIEKINDTCGWGNTPGGIVAVIEDSLKPKFNYKSVFQNFRSTIISSARTLTRMRPNRRYGYDIMGSKRNFTTKLLVAVDTSGSISDKDLKYALGFIQGFFKYGIDAIDCVSFDTKVYDETLTEIKKAKSKIKINGRGGTDFNDIFAFVNERGHFYNGVIIFTDGYAATPNEKWINIPGNKTKYIWCMCDKKHYDNAKNYSSELEKFGKITYIEK